LDSFDTENNALDYDLAKSVGVYFRLSEKEMNTIINDVKIAVSHWQVLATKNGISRGEQLIMEKAFNI